MNNLTPIQRVKTQRWLQLIYEYRESGLIVSVKDVNTLCKNVDNCCDFCDLCGRSICDVLYHTQGFALGRFALRQHSVLRPV